MLFSVIIATYNRADLLSRCLESLVNQTYKDFEVIVCDDGSTDKTFEVVKKYENILNLKYSYDENWGGPARPRNRGISLAKGEFICFLDSDDWWYPNKLLECKKHTKDMDLIYHRLTPFNTYGEYKKKLIQARQVKHNIINDLLLNTNAIPNSSAVIRKSILRKVGNLSEEKSLIAVEDFDCWLNIARVTSKFYFVDKSLGGYWVGESNISLSNKQINRELALVEKHSKLLDIKTRQEVYKRLAYRLGRMSQINNNTKLAIKYYSTAISSSNLKIILKSIYFIFLISFSSIRNTMNKK